MNKEKNYRVSVYINDKLKESVETGKMYDAHIKAFYIIEDLTKQYPYARIEREEITDEKNE